MRFYGMEISVKISFSRDTMSKCGKVMEQKQRDRQNLKQAPCPV